MFPISGKVKHMAGLNSSVCSQPSHKQREDSCGDTGILSGNCYVLGGKKKIPVYSDQMRNGSINLPALERP